ncbi:acyl-CoA-like ligand-binding transcription factor [Nonomuraea turcica]|uniref:acyl-CoA-like ligand-binding transcription factor n=1 Tax=Nonomuraea sp. G32 TaxID=3067274 RepID=UPI00273C911F|nr:TetR family transcriptional regulator [Nonomuraea sp. G32]MDP4500929.1 TetR family transcriptional regulator [Nonomuraea sp. G32]
MNVAAPANMAERKRRLVRDELTEAAVKLLAYQGFDETTVDQIVAAVGMSRRTFSRYFESKEDVIVHMLAGAGAQLCAQLRARPADESPAAALRHALSVFTAMMVDHPDKTLHVTRLILGTPALLARFLERQSHWQAEMTTILAERTGLAPDTDLRPTLAAGVALTAFNAALRRWADGDGTADMDELVDEAFTAITPALDLATDVN